MKTIISDKTFEELMAMKKHDRVIYIYELLNDCKVKVIGDGRLFQIKDGQIDQVKYSDMLKVYAKGANFND